MMCMLGYVAKATFLSVVTYWEQEKPVGKFCCTRFADSLTIAL